MSNGHGRAPKVLLTKMLENLSQQVYSQQQIHKAQYILTVDKIKILFGSSGTVNLG